jgi:REP-associated tyrosine transposase
MVRHPREYRWSSYRANAQGAADPIVTPHPLYRSLGRSARERQESYREPFRERLPDAFIDDLRNATNGGWALGDDAFKRRIAKGAKRRAEPLPKGRPAAKSTDKRQLNLL